MRTPEPTHSPHVVLVPSVGRPEDLERCLRGLQQQTGAQAFDTAVIARRSDLETRAVCERDRVRVILVEGRGVAEAIQAGLAASAGASFASFIDDDAIPLSDWASRIQTAMADPSIGALGGRDNVDGDRSSGDPNTSVGLIGRTGTVRGNHHLGQGSARDVDQLKGANMTFRVEAVQNVPLTHLIKGSGAQYRFELTLCLAVSRGGRRVVYDPRIQVDHFPARRAPGDERSVFGPGRVWIDQHNLMVAVAGYGRPSQLVAVFINQVLRGNRGHPGLFLVAPLVILRQDVKGPLTLVLASVRGLLAGTKDGLRHRRTQGGLGTSRTGCASRSAEDHALTRH